LPDGFAVDCEGIGDARSEPNARGEHHDAVAGGAGAKGPSALRPDLMEKFVERARQPPMSDQPLVYDPGGDLPLLPVRIGDGGIGEN
jgi:hypothetical protein